MDITNQAIVFPMKKFSLAAPILGFLVIGWVSMIGWKHIISQINQVDNFIIGLWFTVLIALCYATYRSVKFAYARLKYPKQFICLDDGNLSYQIYPEGSGKIAYTQIRIVDMQWSSYKGRIYKGRLHLYYLLENLAEDMGNYHHKVLKLDYLLHPDKQWWHYMKRDLYLETLLELEQQLTTRIPNNLLHSKLEYEKYQTRVWLNKFNQ